VTSPRRSITLAALALAAVFAVGACSTSGSGAVQDPVREVAAAEAVDLLDGRTVIDVRRPDEFAAGHVAGALNINVEDEAFDSQIGELDKDAPYLLYCHSGRRSAVAAERMAQAGFSDIVDAGGFQALADAGAPVE
jgi:rhodanese-related sulfurtransferase